MKNRGLKEKNPTVREIIIKVKQVCNKTRQNGRGVEEINKLIEILLIKFIKQIIYEHTEHEKKLRPLV